MGAAPLRRRGRPRRAAAAAVAAAGLALAALALFSGAYPTAISNVDPEAAGTDGAFAPDAVDAALAARDAALQRFVAARQANLAASLTTSTPLRERLRLFDRAGLTNANPPPCPVPYEWTPDLQDADVVVYDILRAGGGAAAAGARPGQRHALLSGESGKNYPVVWAAKQAGYDLSADYRITPTAVNGPAEAPAMYYNAEEYSDFRAPPTLPKRADAILAAFISNCDEVSTSRLAVLRELAALIPVHSYGACAHAAPGEASRGERDFGGAKVKVIRDYAFTFAAENSEEPGYVTEKVYHALEAGSIPVYMGAPDVELLVPHPSSIIKVSDFPTVAALAAHLRELAGDDAAYAAHFGWKRRRYSASFRELQWLARWTTPCRIAAAAAGWRWAPLQEAAGGG